MIFNSRSLFVRFNVDKQLFYIGDDKWGSINDAIISDVKEKDSIPLIDAFIIIEDWCRGG